MKKDYSIKTHTVGPVSKDVPESTIAAQPPSQKPGATIHGTGKISNSDSKGCLFVF